MSWLQNSRFPNCELVPPTSFTLEGFLRARRFPICRSGRSLAITARGLVALMVLLLKPRLGFRSTPPVISFHYDPCLVTWSRRSSFRKWTIRKN